MAHADTPDRVELGVFLGAHFFNDHNELGQFDKDPTATHPKNGFLFGARLGIVIVPRLVLEGEIGAVPTKTADPSEASVFVLVFRGQLLFNFLTEGVFRPFAVAGGGAEAAVSSDNTNLLYKDTDACFHLGLGFKLQLGQHWGLRVDGRILFPPSTENESFTEDFEVMAGPYISFGGHKEAAPVADRDGDGIPDDQDACPDQPGPKTDDPKTNGCPPAPPSDRDGDGIADSEDACPDVKGVKTGDPKTNGCPPDKDGDGISDDQDVCPDVPGLKTGDPKTQGCPDPDGDKDKVCDAWVSEKGLSANFAGICKGSDKCPTDPETVNGYQDDDGCPDEVPKEVKKFTGIIKGINFKFNSAEITKNSFKTLDEAAAVLVANPSVKVEISGHTDSKGSHDYNVDLSQRRSESVKAYLVKKGVPENRLQAIGYGPDKPIADNKTDKGRAQNRRVEFKLITE